MRGKTLLHLQCHFGMDTLSWAREGASVTGVDFSPEAIRRRTQPGAGAWHTEARFMRVETSTSCPDVLCCALSTLSLPPTA